MKKLTQKILFGFVGKMGIVSLTLICLSLLSTSVKAQQTLLVNYDFASAIAGTPCIAMPVMTAANVTSTFTTGGTSGETCSITQGEPVELNSTIGFAFVENKDANQAVSVSSSSFDSVNYFQFQLSGVSAYRNYKLHFQPMQSGTIDVQYSIDGNNFTSFIQIPKNNFPDNFPTKIVDLSSVTAINGQPTVYFRLVGRSNYNPGLYFVIDNFQIQATAATKSRKRVRFF